MKERKKPIHPYLKDLGAEIKRVRVQRKLSLENVGSQIGLDASNLQKIEQGHNLTINTLLKLCILLRITPAKLLDKVQWSLTDKDIDALTTTRPIKKKKVKKEKSQKKAA